MCIRDRHIEDAMAVGAYEAFEKAVFEMTPEAVIKTVTDAGLRGRGGAGFPAGKKWTQVASQKEKIRYVVCNGDEGDPGAFMDRSVMEMCIRDRYTIPVSAIDIPR